MTHMLQGEIVILDDKSEELSNFKKVLHFEGFDVHLISSVKEILTKNCSPSILLREGHLQQIFLVSLDLEGQNPYEAIKKLSSKFRKARIGCLAYEFDSESAEELFALGIDAFFTKPISIEKFLQWVAGDDSLYSTQASAVL